MDNMIFDIKHKDMDIKRYNFRFEEYENINRLQANRIMELEDELNRYKSKYELDVSGL